MNIPLTPFDLHLPLQWEFPNGIVVRMWRLYKMGIGLTAEFIGLQSITQLSYSVCTLQFTVHSNTCQVFSLCLH
jgi:hypothetical protein